MPLDGERPFAFKEFSLAQKRRGSAMDTYDTPALPKELAPIEDIKAKPAEP